MTDAVTQQAIREAIRSDMRSRIAIIIDRLEHQMHELDEPEHLAEALRLALVEVSDALAEGVVAQMRESAPERPGGDRR